MNFDLISPHVNPMKTVTVTDSAALALANLQGPTSPADIFSNFLLNLSETLAYNSGVLGMSMYELKLNCEIIDNIRTYISALAEIPGPP